MTLIAVYGLLCLSAFLSATLLPGSSEAVLLGLLASGQGSPAVLVLFATLGNAAGAVVNRGLGPLLSSWVLVVGDPLTRMAGVLRVPFGRFLGAGGHRQAGALSAAGSGLAALGRGVTGLG